MDKDSARKKGLLNRDGLGEKAIHEKSGSILTKLMELPEFIKARGLLVYASAKSEVETDRIIEYALSHGKRVYCPKVTDAKKRLMEFCEITDIGNLTFGYFGIREPAEPKEPDERDSSFAGEEVLMLMPGVAFDESRNRVGYKGGFYDRYLEGHPEIRTLALAFDCQILDETIEADGHDIKPHGILTEKRVIYGD